jgi:signal transduction histidine kinase/ligand-binding sensor domain-containing protein/DNA-binding response OmpR family regulator
MFPKGRSAVLILALIAASTRMAGAQDRLAFRHLTIADGLSQNAVTAIVQDRRGFMWFGTRDGLNRYDGYQVVVFRRDPSDPSSIPGNEISALFEDARGRLWVGTRGAGLSRFDPARETFHRLPGGPTSEITGIAEDAGGNLWVGADGEGLYRLPAGEGGALERFRHDPALDRSLASDRVMALLSDRQGVLWVGTDRGLDRLDPAAPDRGFTHYHAAPAAPTGLIDTSVTALYEDVEGRLWVGSTPGVTVFDAGRTRTRQYYHRYRTYRYGWGLANDLVEDAAGRIWVATRSGLMILDAASGTFRYVQPDPLDPESINSDLPVALYRDRSDVIWVGTNGYGINLHDPKATRFHTFRRPEDRPYRLAGFSVYTLFQDSVGTIWIGAGLLYRWDRSTGAFKTFETTSARPDDFGNTGVWSIIEQPRGFLWAATFRGLYHYEIATGRARQYRHDPADSTSLPESAAFDVLRARDGTIWVVTESFVAKLVDAQRGRFQSWRYRDLPATGAWVFPSTVEDAHGTLWIGSNEGLVRFDPASGSVLRFRHDPAQPTSLSHDVVKAILPDPREPDRVLWIGTGGGGLDRFDIAAGTFEHWTRRDGLPNDVVYGVLADESGRLWLSTNRGLSRFDPTTQQFRNYDSGDGLQSDEFNSGAAFRSASGELFFGGLYGFSYFRPDAVRDNPHVPPVAITAFRRANHYETVRDSGTVLSRSISESDTLRLSWRDNVITLEFAALEYSAPGKNRYAYRLVGLNDDWVQSGAVRSATYTNLPPGHFTFQVRASNNDGVWNEGGAALAIVIVPPWWRTGWAYTLYALLAGATLWGLRRYDLNRVRLKHRLAREQAEADQLRELDRARSRFFANVSHEFRTPLTLTLGPLDDLRAGLHGPLTPPMQVQVELARRNAARVLDLINQILDLARAEAGRMPLRARRLDVAALAAAVVQSFRPYAERKALTLDTDLPARPVLAWADPEQLGKVLSNLLSNALKFTPEGGTVRVTVAADAAAVRIAVRDGGPGIPADERARIFDRFHRVESTAGTQPGTGIGLALARELTEMHGGSLTVESAEGFGSTFTVNLKTGRAHLAAGQIVDDLTPWMPPVLSPVPPPPPEAGGDATGEPVDDDVTTVLVVDDNAEIRSYVRRHLAPRYRVVEAADGAAGLELARRLLPDLVLSDVMMPGLDGYELCRALRGDAETDFIPVILLTARAESEDRLAGLREQADDYLTKPFDVRELVARVDNLIALRKRLRDRFAGPLEALHAAPVAVESGDRQFLEDVRAAIEASLGDEDFTVERLARQVAHSRGHLHRRLRELADESPSDLIRRLRLERAAQLLEGRAGSIAEIAYSVGFKSVAHFSNRFHDHFGVRPSAWKGGRAARAEGTARPV